MMNTVIAAFISQNEKVSNNCHLLILRLQLHLYKGVTCMKHYLLQLPSTLASFPSPLTVLNIPG